MELRHLRVFGEVIRCGGFSAAARALGSTQSTVSKIVSQLEHDCGEPLLNRLPNGISMTPAGEVVLRRGRAMLAEQESLAVDLEALRGLEVGHLRIGVPLMGSHLLFAPLIAAYRQRHPGIRIELLEEGSRRLEAAVLSGEIEVGVSLLPAPESFSCHVVCDEPMMAVLPGRHPLARCERIRLKELGGSSCIFFERAFASDAAITAACRRHGIELIEAARSSQPNFMLALVAGGIGIALVPRLIVARPPQGVKAVLIDEPDFRWRLGVSWRGDAPLSPAARRWIDLVREKYPLDRPAT
jgi:DNA-binding transcriptional LysR family regulator